MASQRNKGGLHLFALRDTLEHGTPACALHVVQSISVAAVLLDILHELRLNRREAPQRKNMEEIRDHLRLWSLLCFSLVGIHGG